MRLSTPFNRQRGSMLVISLFVIIIMALLGLAMVRLLNASADAVVHEVYGARALLAAQSSLEQRIKAAFPLTQDGASVCNNTVTKAFANVAGLENCFALSSCSKVTGYVDETTEYFRFQSVGICSAGKITTSRTVAVDAIVE